MGYSTGLINALLGTLSFIAVLVIFYYFSQIETEIITRDEMKKRKLKKEKRRTNPE